MSRPSRDQQRAQARAEREAAERAAQQQAQRKKRLVQLGGILAAVAVVAVVVIVAIGGGSNDSSSPTNAGTVSTTGDATLNAQAEINDRLSGIPQSGVTLGRKDAPITIIEFGDLQCPACAIASQQVLPSVIDDYVRPGKAKLELRDIHFLGPDSERLARFGAAASEQGKLWNVAELVWANQGEENSGYATDAYLRAIGNGVPGLDVKAALATRTSANGPAAARRGQDARAHQRRQLDPDVPRRHGRRPPQGGRRRRPRLRATAAQRGPVVIRRAETGRRTIVMAVLALAGLGISAYLTSVHYADAAPVCAVGHGCQTVQDSKYAEMAGIPVALIGLAGYVAILASLLVRGDNGRLLRVALTGFGFAFSVYLTYLELFRIEAICQWCVGSAVVMTGLFALAVFDFLQPRSARYSALAARR